MSHRFYYATLAVLFVATAAPVCWAQTWTPVPAVNLGSIDPAIFTDDELDRPSFNSDHPFEYYLGNFSQFANAVVETGANRGFIDITVWRNEVDNQPYNARVMENNLSLAYFYSTDRPWNPYYGTTPVRDRLEAALNFWVNMQSSDGRFSEYSTNGWNLASTAFATKFMGQTLTLLQSGPAIDPVLKQKVIDADRKAIMYTLNSSSFYSTGKNYTNQYGNVFAGALAYLSLFNDTEMQTKLNSVYAKAHTDFQSPAGYYYEAGAADWSYNLGTHESNTRMTYNYAKGTSIGDQLVEGEQKFMEWLSYNAVPVPGRSGFILNHAMETRQTKTTMAPMDYSLGDSIELARAFSVTVEDQQARRAQIRTDTINGWPAIDPLDVGDFNGFSPYAFLHNDHYQWHPTAAQKTAATGLLPYNASDHFIHQRANSGATSSVSTYVRRADYYAAFNAGPLKTSQQRFGLGLLWNPTAGVFIQSQTNSQDMAWGTRASSAANVYEASALNPLYNIDGTGVTPQTGARDLANGDLKITYNLGSVGTKSLTFADEQILVQVTHPGDFYEQIPLLMLSSDVLVYDTQRVRLVRGDITMEILLNGASQVDLISSSTRIDDYYLRGLSIHGYNSLSYTIITVPEPAVAVLWLGAMLVLAWRRRRG